LNHSRVFKRSGGMTTGALTAKLAIVQVIIAMTANTACGRLGHVIRTRLVARLAGHIHMRAIKDKAGTGVVIEFPQQPVIRVVTGATVLTQAALVWIILCVTIGTYPGGVGKIS
jgi:hypothetical protein